MPFTPRCTATAIGSFPHKDPGTACDLILNTLPEIPTWPQLPNASYKEHMGIQYSEGMVGVVLDPKKKRMHFNTLEDSTSALEKFYENYLAENLNYFKISPQYSRGIYEMETRLSNVDRSSMRYFKSQVTGPVTFGLTVVDENKRAIYYNDIYRDIVVKGLLMKARWILKKFKPFGIEQICFVDEPILAAFGSSTYISVQRNDVINCLKEVIDAIHEDGALAGTHCCGNTDWTIPIDADVDIISFDAYDYMDTITYYPEEIKKFLDKGGTIAWGIIPTSDHIRNETSESLINKLEKAIKSLVSKGLSESVLWEQCLLTPSCGTGSLSTELSEQVFYKLNEISNILFKNFDLPE